MVFQVCQDSPNATCMLDATSRTLIPTVELWMKIASWSICDFQKQTISPQMAVGQIHTNNIKYKKMPLSSIVHNFRLWTISQNWSFRWLSKQNWCFPCSTINVGVSQLSNNNNPPLPAKTPTVIVVSMKIMTSSPGTPLGMVDSQQKLDQNQNPQDIYIIIYIYVEDYSTNPKLIINHQPSFLFIYQSHLH